MKHHHFNTATLLSLAGLSVRALNVCARLGCKTVGDLADIFRLKGAYAVMATPNCGKKTLEELLTVAGASMADAPALEWKAEHRPKARKRIAIVDHHPVTREGLAQWIRNEPDLEVCCKAATAEQGLDAAAAMKPDLLLTDISMPGKDGLAFIKDLHATQPKLPVLVISMHEESVYAERAIRAGARGYVMKHEGDNKVVQAIRRLLDGGIYLSDALSSRILEHFFRYPNGSSPFIAKPFKSPDTLHAAPTSFAVAGDAV